MIKNRIDNLITEFKSFSDWESRYKNLIEIGKNLEIMSESLKVDENKIKGCQSQVWLSAELKDGKVIFHADSDASIVKGIVALLVRIYSNSTPDEILSTRPDFLSEIGLKEHLSMSRANGLNAMVKQISIYAIVFKSKLGE